MYSELIPSTEQESPQEPSATTITRGQSPLGILLRYSSVNYRKRKRDRESCHYSVLRVCVHTSLLVLMLLQKKLLQNQYHLSLRTMMHLVFKQILQPFSIYHTNTVCRTFLGLIKYDHLKYMHTILYREENQNSSMYIILICCFENLQINLT